MQNSIPLWNTACLFVIKIHYTTKIQPIFLYIDIYCREIKTYIVDKQVLKSLEKLIAENWKKATYPSTGRLSYKM